MIFCSVCCKTIKQGDIYYVIGSLNNTWCENCLPGSPKLFQNFRRFLKNETFDNPKEYLRKRRQKLLLPKNEQ